MTNKLTTQEISKVFAMYLGADVDVKDYDNDEPLRLEAVNIEGCIWTNLDDQETGVYIDEAKLLLTPLSKISDEDAIKVTRIYPANIDHLDKFDDGTTFIHRDDELKTVVLNFWEEVNSEEKDIDTFPLTINYNGECFDHRGISNNQNLIFQYLISKSYAVPLFFSPDHWANGKTAIELGISIEKHHN